MYIEFLRQEDAVVCEEKIGGKELAQNLITLF